MECRGILEKIIISRLSPDEYSEFDKIYSNYMASGDRSLYEIWLQPKLIMLESKYKADAMDKYLQKKYYSYVTDMMENLTADETEGLLPVISNMKRKEEKDEIEKKTEFVLLTICPAGNAGFMECQKYMTRLCKCKFIKKYSYCFEQRFNGEPTEKYKVSGDGLHIHLFFIIGDYKRAFVLRDVKRCFGTMVVNVDFKYIKECDLLKVKNYMVGEKADDDKKIKQRYDKEFRQVNDIKDYYGEWFNEF